LYIISPEAGPVFVLMQSNETESGMLSNVFRAVRVKENDRNSASSLTKVWFHELELNTFDVEAQITFVLVKVEKVPNDGWAVMELN